MSPGFLPLTPQAAHTQIDSGSKGSNIYLWNRKLELLICILHWRKLDSPIGCALVPTVDQRVCSHYFKKKNWHKCWKGWSRQLVQLKSVWQKCKKKVFLLGSIGLYHLFLDDNYIYNLFVLHLELQCATPSFHLYFILPHSGRFAILQMLKMLCVPAVRHQWAGCVSNQRQDPICPQPDTQTRFWSKSLTAFETWALIFWQRGNSEQI